MHIQWTKYKAYKWIYGIITYFLCVINDSVFWHMVILAQIYDVWFCLLYCAICALHTKHLFIDYNKYFHILTTYTHKWQGIQRNMALVGFYICNFYDCIVWAIHIIFHIADVLVGIILFQVNIIIAFRMVKFWRSSIYCQSTI